MKVAVLLVFQPGGIQTSTVDQCQWLAEKGYAPLLVFNSPLTTTDVEQLQPHIWRAITRSNFGYDFGGYRDALLSLENWQVQPETLLIFNDSVWVPIFPESNLLERLENNPADIAGSVWRSRGNRRFLEGYCYRFSGHVLRAPEFKKFWAELRLTSNKYYVIRRGERGFSYCMQRADYKMDSVYDIETLPDLIALVDGDFLHKTIRYASNLPFEVKSEHQDLIYAWEVTDRRDWSAQARNFVAKVYQMQAGYMTFPYAACRLLGFPFLKKTNNDVVVEWREAFFAAVEAGDLPSPSDAIRKELQDSVSRQLDSK
mgnify:CR=1 FL=1